MPKGGRSRSLTQDEIIDEALDLLRRVGMAGLTMRAVAAKLGVTPMAVYYYIADKDDLIRKSVEKISVTWGPLILLGSDWESALRKHLMAIWEESTRYPGLSAYLIDQPTMGVTNEKLVEGVQFFEEAGFSPETAPLAWSFALTYIHGRISVDAKLGHRPDAPHIDGIRAHDYVEFGVEAVITGLRAIRQAEAETGSKEARGPKSVQPRLRRVNVADTG